MTDKKLLANYHLSISPYNGSLFTGVHQQKIKTIGISVNNLDDYFTANLLKGMASVSCEAGYELVITHSQRNPEKEIENTDILLNSRVEGVIALPQQGGNKHGHFGLFNSLGIPMVCFNQVQHLGQTDTILIDYRGGGYMATEHLLMQGSKHIVMVTGKPNAYDNLQYYKGYKDAMRKYAVEGFSPVIISDGTPPEDGQAIAAQIMKLNKMPDGLLFTNDIEAAGCMQLLKNAGLSIPRDISIVSCGNSPVTSLTSPSLTAIDACGFQAGEAAAKALVNRLTGSKVVLQHKVAVMPTKLIVRNSSLKISAAAL